MGENKRINSIFGNSGRIIVWTHKKQNLNFISYKLKPRLLFKKTHKKFEQESEERNLPFDLLAASTMVLQ